MIAYVIYSLICSLLVPAYLLTLFIKNKKSKKVKSEVKDNEGTFDRSIS